MRGSFFQGDLDSRLYFHIIGTMKSEAVVLALSALAQESRLTLYRLLVKRGPEGYTPGEIGERLDIPAPTLSFHLKALSSAGLIAVRREGRFLYYTANFAQMSGIVAFLTEHCCSLATDCASADCAPARLARRKSA
jgi:ArsR family transcriptional regulator, arsenate/arsenite/antimonite-responsive transcriptional repressor